MRTTSAPVGRILPRLRLNRGPSLVMVIFLMTLREPGLEVRTLRIVPGASGRPAKSLSLTRPRVALVSEKLRRGQPTPWQLARTVAPRVRLRHGPTGTPWIDPSVCRDTAL